MNDSSSEIFAYLGPEGSNSQLALQKFFPTVASSVACESFSIAVGLLLADTVTAALVPIENLLGGPVAETLDLLSENAGKVWIENAFVLPIRSALGALEKSSAQQSNLSAIRRIYSHPQPLQQCSIFLDASLPQAQRIESASTSAACQKVREEKLLDAAVIASPETLSRYGLRVLIENITPEQNNRTRFVVLRRGNRFAGPYTENRFAIEHEEFSLGNVTSIGINPKKDRQGMLLELLEIISGEHHVNLLSIHTRPDSRGGFIFHIDLEGNVTDGPVARCLASLERYCHETTRHTAELSVFGSYPRSSFLDTQFHSVGIVGGEGEMGRWFQRFFEALGFEVHIHDETSKMPIKDFSAKSDVILFSVPMSRLPEVVTKLAPVLRPSQLVVENCSVKTNTLPLVLSACPKGAEVLGIHTMFAGDRESIHGENIVIVRTEFSGEKAQAFEDLLYKHGARLTRTTIDDHDRRVAVLQSLVQLLALAFADACQKLGVKREELLSLSTPNARRLLDIVERVLGQADALTRDIQLQNPSALLARRKFLESIFTLTSQLENSSHDNLAKILQENRLFHGISLRGKNGETS